MESECIQHRSQLDLKQFQDLHQYVDSLSYTCENQTASGTWLVHRQARLVRHRMFSELADVLMSSYVILLVVPVRSPYILYNSLHFPIFPDSSGDFEGAAETNIWDALQPSIVRMTSRRGSVSQLAVACGELTIPMARLLTKRSVRN